MAPRLRDSVCLQPPIHDEPNMRKLFAATLLAIAGLALAATPVYDEAADARADIRSAQAQARQAGLPLIVVFGANWCGDCKVLDMAFKSGPAAALMAQHFKVVKVDVGRLDRNVDVAESLGVPLKSGIPAVAVLSDQGKPIYVTRAGELADARKMGDQAIHDFFARMAGITR